MDVSHQLGLAADVTRHAVDADVDDASARLDGVGRDEIRDARCRDNDVGRLRQANHVVTRRVAVTDRRRRVACRETNKNKNAKSVIRSDLCQFNILMI